MKKIVLLLSVFFLFKVGYSQNLVGKTTDEIFTFLENKGVPIDSIKIGKNNNGSDYISYQGIKNKFIYFMDSTLTCFCYRVVYPYSELNNVTKQLNERFTPHGHFKWLDYEQETYVIILEKMDDYFVTDMMLDQ